MYDRPVSTGGNTYNHGIGSQPGGLIATSDGKPDLHSTSVSRLTAKVNATSGTVLLDTKQKEPSFYPQKQCPANIL